MAMQGVLSQLANIQGELDAQAKANGQLDKANEDATKHHGHKQKDVTHHYKVAATQTLEVDDSVVDKDDSDNEVKKTETRRKSCGCFSACFGRKR